MNHFLGVLLVKLQQFALRDTARRAVAAIRQGVKVLERQPGVGRPVDDMDDEFRDWIIDFGDSGYVARYRVDPQSVSILAVRHQKEVGF
ncbi:MAG: type II toxin-antitoxin system RelE/ParE family toxin [Burkholderiaceae bacterium]